jgi:hypothetical protein
MAGSGCRTPPSYPACGDTEIARFGEALTVTFGGAFWAFLGSDSNRRLGIHAVDHPHQSVIPPVPFGELPGRYRLHFARAGHDRPFRLLPGVLQAASQPSRQRRSTCHRDTIPANSSAVYEPSGLAIPAS